MELWNCTGAEYHADDSLSQSKIKTYLRSPEEYHEKYVAQTAAEKETPRHFQYGTDFERLLFYGEAPGIVIPQEVLSARERDGKTSYAKSGLPWREFQRRMMEQHGDDVRLLKQEEWNRDVLPLLLARDKLREHGAAKKLVYGQGTPHMAFRWTDEETGLACKCQLDMLHGFELGNSEPRVVVDVKSARDATPEAFSKAIGNFGYHIQAWWYREAVRLWSGLTLPFVFVVSQSTPPYTCETYDLDPRWFEIAEQQIRQGMRRIQSAMQTNNWHSETHGTIVTLQPKPWDYPR